MLFAAGVVVNCSWTNAELACSCKSGYLWNKTAGGDHLTFSVPRATEGQPRMYACEVQGYNVSLTKSCWDIVPRGILSWAVLNQTERIMIYSSRSARVFVCLDARHAWILRLSFLLIHTHTKREFSWERGIELFIDTFNIRIKHNCFLIDLLS